MKILKRLIHKELGEICCIADKNDDPLMWVKYIKSNIFSKVEKELKICLNLYCFNKDYECDDYWKDKSKKVELMIQKSYEAFLKDGKDVEKIFYNYFEKEVIKKEDIKSIEDLYLFVATEEVRIFLDGYAVIISTPWDDECFGIEKRDIFEENPWYNVNIESEIDIIEMDYE